MIMLVDSIVGSESQRLIKVSRTLLSVRSIYREHHFEPHIVECSTTGRTEVVAVLYRHE